jgi:hypothetical protein
MNVQAIVHFDIETRDGIRPVQTGVAGELKFTMPVLFVGLGIMDFDDIEVLLNLTSQTPAQMRTAIGVAVRARATSRGWTVPSNECLITALDKA